MKEERSYPPKWADRMLSWFCAEEHLEILLGDLHELFEYRYETKGKFRARLHYIKDAFDMLRPFALKKRKSKLRISQIDMFRNHLKIGWRNILRYKGYSTINIAGLALGLACCIILYRFVKDELSYDSFHANADNIYRVVFSTEDDKQPSNANGSFGPGPVMTDQYPEVENYMRFKMNPGGNKIAVSYGEKAFYESRFVFADSTIFNVFSFPLIQGNPETALTGINSIVITESTARKYFGDENAMGEVLTADPYNDGNTMDFMVTGVVEDVPSNSHVHFDFLASFHSQRGNFNNWNGFTQVFSYVLLNPGADPQLVNEKLLTLPAEQMGEGNDWYSLSLQPLRDIYLKSSLKSEIEPTSSVTKITVFTAVGVLILLIACINFLTLSTAKSARRAREVGVRKTFGAYRSQLFGQFISEALLHGFFATLVALGIASLAFPFVNQLTNKSLDLVMNNNWFEVALIFIVANLVVAFMAGLYPAVFLSSFKPVVALKSKITGTGSIARVRKVLVVFQFAISIGLIVASMIVDGQMDLIRERSLTDSGDQVVVLPFSNDIRKNLKAFEAQLDQIPTVQYYSGVSRVPARGSNTSCFDLGEEIRGCAYFYATDFDYPRAMDYQLVAGRLFDPKIGSDSLGAYVINEAAVKEFGFGSPEEALGKQFGDEGFENSRIIGVVEDFHVYSLHRAYRPAYMVVGPKRYYNYMAIRVNPADVGNTLNQIAGAWDTFSPDGPFDYFFLDEAFQQLHIQDIRTGQFVSALTFIAILIAAIGLFGLASFMTEQRSKEIGIRKVLGAGVISILTLMSRSYLRLILLASLIGIPASYWILVKWLNAFEYRAPINMLVFVLAILIVGLVVTGSIGYQSVKAALANPVKSLRHE